LQAALEAVTATHQLEAAMDVFSLCLRPLLRQGYLQPQGQGMDAEKVDTTTQSLHMLTTDLRLDSKSTLLHVLVYTTSDDSFHLDLIQEAITLTWLEHLDLMCNCQDYCQTCILCHNYFGKHQLSIAWSYAPELKP